MVSEKKENSQNRQKFLVVRVSHEEQEKLKENALNLGVTISDYIRKNTLNAPVSSRGKKSNLDHKILGQLLGQIGKIGNNINQLTRSVNSGIIPQPIHLDSALEIWCELEVAILDALAPNFTEEKTISESR